MTQRSKGEHIFIAAIKKSAEFIPGTSLRTNLCCRTVQYDRERFSVLLALAGVLQLVFAYLAISMFDRVAENQVAHRTHVP